MRCPYAGGGGGKEGGREESPLFFFFVPYFPSLGCSDSRRLRGRGSPPASFFGRWNKEGNGRRGRDEGVFAIVTFLHPFSLLSPSSFFRPQFLQGSLSFPSFTTYNSSALMYFPHGLALSKNFGLKPPSPLSLSSSPQYPGKRKKGKLLLSSPAASVFFLGHLCILVVPFVAPLPSYNLTHVQEREVGGAVLSVETVGRSAEDI